MRKLVTLLALPLLGAASPVGSPSFSCTGSLSHSEQAICSDPELAAWDRAIAKLYWIGMEGGNISQAMHQRWLFERDNCGADKVCLRQTFSRWPGYPAVGFGPTFERAAKHDEASLQIAPIGAGWYAFSALAIHMVRDQHGKFLTANDGEAHGVVLITAGKGHFNSDPGDEFSCEIDFVRMKNVWRLHDNGQCGGLNVTMSGTYRRKRGASRM